MGDLILGAVLIYLLAVAVFFASVWLSARCSGVGRILLAGGGVLLTVLYVQFAYEQLWLARLLPWSNVIMLGNWIPLGVAWLAGVVWGCRSIPRWRRGLLGTVLALVALYSLLEPLLSVPPQPQDTWSEKGVCLQSTPASCSACAAAMLLRHYGIAAGEEEMMDLCLTGRRGTPQLGLYRGLVLKTRGTPYRPRAFRASVEELLSTARWPVVLLVHLDPKAKVDPRYQTEWGWEPGTGHAVTVFGPVGQDRIDVGDPSVGREQWTLDDLRVLWHGDAIRLEASDASR